MKLIVLLRGVTPIGENRIPKMDYLVEILEVEIGISIGDLDLLTIDMVLDMWTEKANDDVKYQKVAGQSEFDRF